MGFSQVIYLSGTNHIPTGRISPFRIQREPVSTQGPPAVRLSAQTGAKNLTLNTEVVKCWLIPWG